MIDRSSSRTIIRRSALFGAAVGLALLGALVPLSGSVLSAPAPPPQYADLYAMLDAKLQTIDGLVSSQWSGATSDVIFSAELLPANANIGEPLFREQTWSAVFLNLDRLQRLGGRGVQRAGKYPALPPPFPRPPPPPAPPTAAAGRGSGTRPTRS